MKKKSELIILIGLVFLYILIVEAANYSSNGDFCGVIVYENSNILVPQDCLLPNIGGTINNTGVVLDCQNNQVTGPNDNTGFGIKTNASGSNAIIKRCIVDQFQYNINISTNGTTVIDSRIINGLPGAKDFWLGPNFNATFLNVTFTQANVQVSTGSNLSVQYYVIVNVTNSTGQVANAIVNVYNESIWSSRLNGTTDANGLAYFNVTERVIGPSSTAEFNYSINATTATQNGTNASYDVQIDYGRQMVKVFIANSLVSDTTPPVINLLAPANNSLLNTLTTSFNASFTDTGGLLNSTLFVWNSTFDIINQTNRTITGTTNESNITVTLPYNGRFYWNYYACDSSNNCAFNNTNYTLLVDSVNPGINFTFPTETNNSYLSRNYILVNVSVTDTNLGNITIRLYNSTRDLIRNNISGGTNYFINYSSLSDGIYYINASVNDTVGNVNNTETRIITLDTLNPGIDYGIGTNNSGANVSRNWIYVNVSVVEINEANITFNLYNSTGVVNSTGFTNLNRIINWTNLVDGSYSYNVTIIDLAGNVNNTGTRTILLDTLNPGIEYVSPTDNDGANLSRSNIVINVSVTDINIKNLTIYLYNSTDLVNSTNTTNNILFVNYTNLLDGRYYFNATVYDFTGNLNSTGTRTVLLDTLNPGISYNSNTETDGSNLSRSNIVINVSVTDINFVNVTIDLYNSTGLVNSTLSTSNISYVNITGLRDGRYWFNATALDIAGNRNNTLTRTVLLDTTNPRIEFGNGVENTGVNLSRTWIYVNVTVTEINEKNITFFLYNTTSLVNSTTFSNSARTINFTGLINEIYYYNVTVYDFSGNTNTTGTRILTLDTKAPNVTGLVPALNTEFNTSMIINISANVSDQLSGMGVVLANITYPNGTGSLIVLYNSAGIIYNNIFTIPNLPGIYNVTFIANDSAGNINRTEKTNFSVTDVTAPRVTIVSPANASSSGSATVSVNITIDESGYCFYNIDNGTNTTLTNSGNVSFSGTTSSLSNADYVLYAFCNDTIGNRNDSVFSSFTVNVDSGGGGGGGGGCTKDWQYTAWTNWQNLTCVSGFMNQSRHRTKYDAEKCSGSVNSTEYEYRSTESCGLVCVNECSLIGNSCLGNNATTCSNVSGCLKITNRENCENLSCQNGICIVKEQNVPKPERNFKIFELENKTIPLPSNLIPHGNVPDVVVNAGTGIVVVGGLSWLVWLWLLSLLPFFAIKLRHYSVSILDLNNSLMFFKNGLLDENKLLIFLNILEEKFGKLVYVSKDKNIMKYIAGSGFIELSLDDPFAITGHFTKRNDSKIFKIALKETLNRYGARKVNIIENIERASMIGAIRAYMRKRKSEKELRKIIGVKR